ATWTSIAADLPERGSVYAIAEDHVDPNLLFVGTEFGCYFTRDGGEHWVELSAGLPTIAVRDIAIQRRENDLVLASFGRGFYVMDDYSPLRNATEETLAEDAHIFPIKDALMYLPATPLGNSGKSFQGAAYYTAKNPPVASVFTYYLKEGIKTKKQLRKEKEKEMEKEGKAIVYPSFAEMRAEDEEEKPYLLFTIADADGNVVNRLRTSASKGIKRINWNFRYPSTNPVRTSNNSNTYGRMALPGTYTVSLAKVVDGEMTELTGPETFQVVPLNNATLPAEDKEALAQFQADVAELQRSIQAANRVRSDLENKVSHIKTAIQQTPTVPISMMAEAKAVERQLAAMQRTLTGDRSLSRREFETAPSISNRIGLIMYGMYSTTSAPTQTQKDGYKIAAAQFEPVMKELKEVVKQIEAMESKLEELGAPYTPGRMPIWQRD
ncbi:MAG: glycosyl hydrolase, partial [Bacteroidota bacterium]